MFPKRPRMIRAWRFLNTLVLTIAFIGPWVRGCSWEGTPSGSVSGALLTYSALNTAKDLISQWLATSTPLVSELAMLIPFLVAISGLAIYACVNLVRASRGTWPHSRQWRTVPLVAGSLGLLIASLIFISWSPFLWGYWMTWGGIVSSYGVEAFDPSTESHRQVAVPQAPAAQVDGQPP